MILSIIYYTLLFIAATARAAATVSATSCARTICAPFIIAAYAIVWVALLVYVLMIARGLKKTEAQMALLEEAVAAKHQQQQSICS